jgi:hypothetical protein
MKTSPDTSFLMMLTLSKLSYFLTLVLNLCHGISFSVGKWKHSFQGTYPNSKSESAEFSKDCVFSSLFLPPTLNHSPEVTS